MACCNSGLAAFELVELIESRLERSLNGVERVFRKLRRASQRGRRAGQLCPQALLTLELRRLFVFSLGDPS
jgi:hypothetical protein